MWFFPAAVDLVNDFNWRWLAGKLGDAAVTGLIGAFVAWLVFFRHWLRFNRGDSDDVIFSAHYLLPVPELNDHTALLLRNPLPPSTVAALFDNPAARNLIRKLINATSIQNPVLLTEGTLGFEVLNHITNVATGAMAGNAFPREVWLCALTCEDRAVVRKRCIRVFLIRPDDLSRFGDWDWCKTLYLERWWHYFRVYALHRIALMYLDESARAKDAPRDLMPLVHDQAGHRRVVAVSVGINPTEVMVGTPARVDWDQVAPTLQAIGATIRGR